MDTLSTHITQPPGRWLAALASSLVLWGIAYAQAPAPDAGPADYGAPGFFSTGRGRLQRWLLNDLDNAVALRQLAAGPAGPTLAKASRLAGPGREPGPRMMAANTGPTTRLAAPK